MRGITVLRGADRIAEHVFEGQLAVVAQHRHPAAERARHDGRQQSRAGHDGEAHVPHPLDRHRGGRDALAAEHAHALLLGAVEHHRQFAARAVQMRLHDLQHEARRGRRIECVAAFFEDGHRGGAGEPVRGGHHAEGADQFRPCRECHMRFGLVVRGRE
jgi:hypothetical protein